MLSSFSLPESFLQPLFGAAELWEMILGSLFFILYIIGQLVGNRAEGKAKPKRKPRKAPPKPKVQVPAGAAKNQEEALRSEVEDFLRRAEAGKQEKKTSPKPRPQRRPQPQAKRKPVEPPPRRVARAEQKPPIASGDVACSVPPASMTSASQC